jgi:hypothetical protein
MRWPLITYQSTGQFGSQYIIFPVFIFPIFEISLTNFVLNIKVNNCCTLILDTPTHSYLAHERKEAGPEIELLLLWV